MKLGLALEGGGGKGAYQIGVWKALREYGIDQKITVVAGTSVGALNAALFVYGGYERAEAMWQSVSPQDVFSLGRGSLDDVLSFYRNSCFSRDGVKRLLRALDFARPAAGISCYATCLQVTDPGPLEQLLDAFGKALGEKLYAGSRVGKLVGKVTQRYPVEYFRLNDYPARVQQDILLASSALPFVFPQEKINGHYYIDGGFGDNLPLQPLYDEGCDVIIAVQCNRDSIKDLRRFPGAMLWPIIPQDSQGGLAGTIDFSREGIKRRMEQGYKDTCTMLVQMKPMWDAQQMERAVICGMQQDEAAFSRQHAANAAQKEANARRIEASLRL